MSVSSKSPLEEERLGPCLGQRVDRAIDDIQLRWMPLPLAETAKCIERAPCHFLIEGHHDDPRILQQFVELTDRIRSEAREQNDPGFEDGDRGDQQALGTAHRRLEARAVWLIRNGRDNR